MIWFIWKLPVDFSTVPSWCFLFDGTVPSRCFLRDGTVPSRCILHDGTVLSRCFLYDGTVLSYNHYHKVKKKNTNNNMVTINNIAKKKKCECWNVNIIIVCGTCHICLNCTSLWMAWSHLISIITEWNNFHMNFTPLIMVMNSLLYDGTILNKCYQNKHWYL